MESAATVRAQRGDPEAFRDLVEEHGRALFRLAFRMTGDESTAEDIVQEAFMRAHRSLDKFDGRSQVGTWLHRIAANCALDVLRRRQRTAPERFAQPIHDLEGADEPATPAAGPQRRAESAEIGAAVRQAMGALTPLERAAFSLRHFEGRSSVEIAETLGLRVEGAKHAVFRAVQKLRLALGPLFRFADRNVAPKSPQVGGAM
ncbi:MAG: RNA polymerase sigma factor [Acidobacteriota bacterium]